MSNGTLIVNPFDFVSEENACESCGKLNGWPVGTHCQWLISAVDDKHYVNLEFESLNVRTYEFNHLSCF